MFDVEKTLLRHLQETSKSEDTTSDGAHSGKGSGGNTTSRPGGRGGSGGT
jgi:hypothetical protein